MKLLETVDRLERALDVHRDRHAVLAGNLSNVDTPGYRPVDLAEPTQAGGTDGEAVALTRTHEGHLPVGGARGTSDAVVYTDANDAPGTDGNSVSLERELAKIDANRVRYNATTELVSRKLALLRYTSSDGQL